jgi:predicted Zn-dependent protease
MPLYSRVQELEADAYAVRLLGEMGYEDSSGVFVALLCCIQPVTAILSSTLGRDLLLRASSAPTELVLNTP